jgi:dTDP-glucose 4,6-dehydratase
VSRPRVLLTGAAGFVGHHVAAYLEGLDFDVVAMVRMSKIGDLQRLGDDGFCGDVVWHDLRSPINDSVASHIGKVDYIIHMGAETHVDRSIECPMDFVMGNVVGTTNLLDYARKVGVLKFIQFSTDEVFGPAPDGVIFREEDRHLPKNPYAAAKSGAEQMVVAYQNTFKVPATIVRAMNIFGPRQHKEKFIPMVIRSVMNGEEVTIHANKDLTRAGSRFYVHALVVAHALAFLLPIKPKDETEMYHVVGDQEVDNLQMALTIADIIGKNLKYRMVNFHESRPGHDLRYAMRDTKLKAMGWRRPGSFVEDLEATVRWYIGNPEWLGL